MLTSLLVAGFGGQGVMMIGKLIGECAFDQNLHVTFLPSYGPEQRGGTANCTVIQSDQPIGSPTSDSLDVLCVMNQPSLDKFVDSIRPGGILLTNSSLVDVSGVTRKDIKIVEVDADNLAYEIGKEENRQHHHLCRLHGDRQPVPIETVKAIVMKKLGRKPELLAMNEAAFEKGVQIAREAMNK